MKAEWRVCVEKGSAKFACTKFVHYQKYLPEKLVKVVAINGLGAAAAQSVRCRRSVCVFFSARYRLDAASYLSFRFGFSICGVCDRFGSVCIGFGFGAAFCIVETSMKIPSPNPQSQVGLNPKKSQLVWWVSLA